MENLPQDMIWYINSYLDIKCHVCCRKIDFTKLNQCIVQQFVYCSDECYMFV